MKRVVVASLLVSSVFTVGCTSKEERAYYEAQTKYMEEALDILDTQQEALEQFTKEYHDEVKDIQNQQVPYLTGLTKEDIINIYGEENVTIEEGVYLEECPECGGEYTCKENECWKYSHIE